MIPTPRVCVWPSNSQGAEIPVKSSTTTNPGVETSKAFNLGGAVDHVSDAVPVGRVGMEGLMQVSLQEWGGSGERSCRLEWIMASYPHYRASC